MNLGDFALFKIKESPIPPWTASSSYFLSRRAGRSEGERSLEERVSEPKWPVSEPETAETAAAAKEKEGKCGPLSFAFALATAPYSKPRHAYTYANSSSRTGV